MTDHDETMRSDEQTVIREEDGASQTVGDLDLSDFLRHQHRSRVAGMLTPIQASTLDQWEVDSPEYVVGRDPKCDMTLSDDSVSRRHAMVRKTDEDQFVIEDLGSSNGTYVDGIPILSCVLHSGDSVQFGRNLFIFDRLLELINDDDDEADGF
jgi:pSer/pThr/pTyr-binding forkhead associated (FHA) protein